MNKSLKDFGKNLAIIVVGFLLVSAFMSGFNFTEKEKTVSLTQLANDINAEKVEKITVEGHILTIKYKGEKEEKTSRKEAETSLTQTLANYGVSEEAIKELDLDIKEEKEDVWDWLGPLVLFNLLPLIIIGFFIMQILKQSKQAGGQAFDFARSKAKIFDRDKNDKVNFDQVGGLEEAKEELEEVVEFLKNPKKFHDIGARMPRGILLVGATGTGKTLLAKAVASQAGVPFFLISGSEFIELFVGVGAARVRDLFATAKKHQPAIIFIDELDAIGGARGPGFGGGHEEREQTLNQILVEMDGFDKENTCMILAATNRPDTLDPALLRPGRFDRRVVFDLPDIKSREAILNIHIRTKQSEDDINLTEIAHRTPGFSGADLANLTNEAALLAVKRGKKKISHTELLESIDKVLLGPVRKTHLLSKKEKEISAYHEAGHAVVNTMTPNGKDVRKISIISRGMAGGYTLTLPKEEKYFKSRKEFVSEIATLLGGYCAEELIFGEVTTGAGNDLEVASKIARALVKDYGMSSLGPIVFGEKRGLQYLKGQESEERNYSERLAEEIDREVESIIKEGKKEATKILKDKKALLEKTAKLLIEKEVIEKEEFEQMID